MLDMSLDNNYILSTNLTIDSTTIYCYRDEGFNSVQGQGSVRCSFAQGHKVRGSADDNIHWLKVVLK